MTKHDEPNSMRSESNAALSALSLVRTPRIARQLAVVAMVMLAVITLSFLFVPWQQTVAGSGMVTSFVPSARPQTVEAVVSGRIVAWFVYEGATVRKGDTIAVLQDINVNFMDTAFVDRLETARDNVLLAQDAAVISSIERTKQAVQALEAGRAGLDAAKMEVGIARVRYARAMALVDSGLISQRDVETATVNLNKAKNDSVRFETVVQSARQNVEAVRSEQERVQRQAQVFIAEADLRLSNARSRRNAAAVISPVDGQVVRIAKAGSGQTVKEGERLATIVPTTADIAAEIYVSDMDAALVDIGRTVTLQFAGYPAFQFSGFPDISTGIFRGTIAAVDAVDDGGGRFRLLVVPDESRAPWPSRSYLRQGSTVTGWVLLQSVPLGYEIWRQLNGFPPLFPVREHDKSGKAKKTASDAEKEKK
ncbi:MAG: HlyD family secretion protein [Candidatus Kapaibacterium sp.]